MDNQYLVEQTEIHSEHAPKYLNTLCRHFGRKVESTWNETEGTVKFPVGTCSMAVEGECLTIRCAADNDEKLQQQKAIINSHVQMFSRREEIELSWSSC